MDFAEANPSIWVVPIGDRSLKNDAHMPLKCRDYPQLYLSGYPDDMDLPILGQPLVNRAHPVEQEMIEGNIRRIGNHRDGFRNQPSRGEQGTQLPG